MTWWRMEPGLQQLCYSSNFSGWIRAPHDTAKDSFSNSLPENGAIHVIVIHTAHYLITFQSHYLNSIFIFSRFNNHKSSRTDGGQYCYYLRAALLRKGLPLDNGQHVFWYRDQTNALVKQFSRPWCHNSKCPTEGKLNVFLSIPMHIQPRILITRPGHTHTHSHAIDRSRHPQTCDLESKSIACHF